MVFDVRVMLFLFVFKSSVGRSAEQSKPGVAVVRHTVVQMAQRDRRTGAAGQPRLVGRGSVPESQTVRGGHTPGNVLSPEANSGHGPAEIVTRYDPSCRHGDVWSPVTFRTYFTPTCLKRREKQTRSNVNTRRVPSDFSTFCAHTGPLVYVHASIVYRNTKRSTSVSTLG